MLRRSLGRAYLSCKLDSGGEERRGNVADGSRRGAGAWGGEECRGSDWREGSELWLMCVNCGSCLWHGAGSFGGAGIYGSTGGAGGPQGSYYGTEQRDGATIDKYMVQEAQQVPFKQITYTTQEVQQPRTYMEPVTKSIQVRDW